LIIAASLVAISVMVATVGCQKGKVLSAPPILPAITSNLPASQPVVRVRIVKRAVSAVFENTSGLWLAPPGENNWQRLKRLMPSPLHIARVDGEYIIVDGSRQRLRWQVDQLMIVSQDGSPVGVNSRTYPQTVLLRAANSANIGGTFDVINHVRMESYLPGVLQKELYTTWHPTAFAAQAIAARTYAMHNVMTSTRRHFDLESTTASQAYVGASASQKARRAVEQTGGRVLLYRGRIFPAYYSSSCGGIGQDAAWAFPEGLDIAPLRGTQRHEWCQQSRYYRWGPIDRHASILARRMAAWGRTQKHAVAAISAIRHMYIEKTNHVGRPTRFVVTDHNGRSYKLDAEQMRMACNHDAPGIGSPARAQNLRSSHMQIQINGDVVTFYDGRGFGHGVGLCQWGMQAMSQHGYDHMHILATYYPGAQVRQLY
jgi:stage II sporulation protein D